MRESILLTAMSLGIVSVANAQTSWTGAAGSDWSDAANWSDGVPGVASVASINDITSAFPVIDGIAVDKSSGPPFNDFWVGQSAEGRLDIVNGGSLDVNGTWMFLGDGAGGQGVLNLNNGGSIQSNTHLRIGGGGATGILNVDGGTVTVGTLANLNPAGNVFHFSNNANVTTLTETSLSNLMLTGLSGEVRLLGGGAAGVFDQSLGAGDSDIAGGTLFTDRQLVVGNGFSSTLTLGSGGISATTGIQLGAEGGAGVFNLNGGMATVGRVISGGGASNMNFNGGTLVAGKESATFVGPAVVTEILVGGMTVDTSGFSVGWAGSISGTGGLTKLGAGRLTMPETTTFSGQTVVGAGTLQLGLTSATSSVSVDPGAALGVEPASDSLGSTTVPSVVFEDGAIAEFDTAVGNRSEKLVVSDADGLSFGSLSIRLLADGSSNGSTAGIYTIIEYAGSHGGDVADLLVVNPRSGYGYEFADTGSSITVAVIAPDTDGDGMDDDWEDANGLDKFVNDADGNADGDFSSNFEEFIAETDPQDASDDPKDLDNDDLPDAWEIENFGDSTSQSGDGDPDGDFDRNALEFVNSTDPNLATDFSDTDGDGIGDGWEIAHFGSIGASDGSGDFDDDDYSDLQEWKVLSDPTDSESSPAYFRVDHRWSFNGDLSDSGAVGGSDAVIMPGDVSSDNPVTQTSTAVEFSGGAKADSEWVQLGTNLLPDNNRPMTIELWATYGAVQNWSRVFNFFDPSSSSPEELFMTWNTQGDPATDRVEWSDVVRNNATQDDTNGFTVGATYHIVLVVEPETGNAEATRVTWYSAETVFGDLEGSRGSFTSDSRLADLNDVVAALGRSWWPDNAPTATYDEVRIFSGRVPDWALEYFHDQGPDDPSQVDSDSDGLPDAWEDFYFFGDFGFGPADDPDMDGYSNRDELAAGTDPDLDFSNPGDLDADGLEDDWEIANFGNLDQFASDDPDGDREDNETEFIADTDPNDYFSFSDINDNGIADGWEEYHFFGLIGNTGVDDDGDGLDALAEFNAMADPLDPISPGHPAGDADGDGLPDAWEVSNFGITNLQDVAPDDDSDTDGDDNLTEYRATSNPNDFDSTADDINGDGVSDGYSFLDMDSTGGGVVDGDGEATQFESRLTGSGAGLPVQDPNLDLVVSEGYLSVTTNAGDINGQGGVAELEAIGVPLSSVGFAGGNDFRIRAHITHMPETGGIDQIGAYVGDSTTSMTRAAAFGGGFGALGVNTSGNNDSGAFFGPQSTGQGRDLTVVIERTGGVWSMSCNGVICTPAEQPGFLNGSGTLQAGVFGTHQEAARTFRVESFTVVSFGISPADVDDDGDGMADQWELDRFGNTGRDGTGDLDGDGVTDLEEFAFNGDPGDGASTGEGSFSTEDSNLNSLRDLTLTVAVRSGAVFGAAAQGGQVASVGGITYLIRGGTDLATWTGGVTHVGSVPASDPGWELHTFRLDSSEGLDGKGFLEPGVRLSSEP